MALSIPVSIWFLNNYKGTFNLPSIVNSTRQSWENNNSEFSHSKQQSQNLSSWNFPAKMVKGLHNYGTNKENIWNENSSKSNSFGLKLKSAEKETSQKSNIYGWNKDESPSVVHKLNPIDDIEPLEASNLFESAYIMDNDENIIKEHIKKEMEIFNIEYDITLK